MEENYVAFVRVQKCRNYLFCLKFISFCCICSRENLPQKRANYEKDGFYDGIKTFGQETKKKRNNSNNNNNNYNELIVEF